MKDKLFTSNPTTCKNHGYQNLTSDGQWFEMTSGSYGEYYGNDERCYWSVYAPGSRELRIEILYFNVVSDFKTNACAPRYLFLFHNSMVKII